MGGEGWCVGAWVVVLRGQQHAPPTITSFFRMVDMFDGGNCTATEHGQTRDTGGCQFLGTPLQLHGYGAQSGCIAEPFVRVAQRSAGRTLGAKAVKCTCWRGREGCWVPGGRGRSTPGAGPREPPMIGRYWAQPPPPSPLKAPHQRDPQRRHGRAARSTGTAIGWRAGVSLGVGTTGVLRPARLAVPNDGEPTTERLP